MPLHAHIIHDIDGDTFRANPTPTLTLTLTILHYTLHTRTHMHSCLCVGVCVCVKNLQFLVLFSSSCLIFCNHSRKSCQSTLSSLDDQQPSSLPPLPFLPPGHIGSPRAACTCVRNRYPQLEPSRGIV